MLRRWCVPESRHVRTCVRTYICTRKPVCVCVCVCVRVCVCVCVRVCVACAQRLTCATTHRLTWSMPLWAHGSAGSFTRRGYCENAGLDCHGDDDGGGGGGDTNDVGDALALSTNNGSKLLPSRTDVFAVAAGRPAISANVGITSTNSTSSLTRRPLLAPCRQQQVSQPSAQCKQQCSAHPE